MSRIFGSVIKRQTSQTTSDYEWLQARLRGTTSYNKTDKSGYKWLRVTTTDYKPDYEGLRV